MKLSIILPTYNERANILPLIKELKNNLVGLNSDYEIAVIDDNSPDKTGEEAKRFSEKYQNINCIIRYDEKGLASAIKEGIQKTSGELIVIMDTDFSHPPITILKLFENLKDNDLIVASRYVKEGSMDAPWHKYFGSFILNKAISIILGFKVKDSTGGFFILRREALQNLNLNKIFKGYGEFSFRLLYAFKKTNKKIEEIPFRYAIRRYGKSKTNLLKVGFNYLYEAFKVRFDL